MSSECSAVNILPGYKKTEVGMIPEDWEVSSLRNCCSKITDGTHDTPKPVRSGIPFLTAIHVKENCIDYDSCLYVTEADHKIIFSRCNPGKNDVLMVNIGMGVATTALVNVNYEFSLKNVALLKPESRRTIGSYLNYSLAQIKQKITQDLSSGGAQPFLSLTQIGEITIPLPPTLAEQEAISEALSDANAFIESLEQLIAKRRQIKQCAMQELLTGKKRLPGFGEGKGYKQTELGVIPEDWEVKPMAELFTFQNGVNADKSSYGSGTPFINVLEVITYSTITETRIPGRISLSTQTISAFAVQNGDILFNRTSETQEEVGLTSVYIGNEVVVFGGFVIRARPKDSSLDSIFTSYVLRSLTVRLQIVALGQGAVRANIGQQGLSRVLVVLPTITEQEAIATILSEMDSEISALEEKLTKARQIKQGMMQELLTGRIRLR